MLSRCSFFCIIYLVCIRAKNLCPNPKCVSMPIEGLYLEIRDLTVYNNLLFLFSVCLPHLNTKKIKYLDRIWLVSTLESVTRKKTLRISHLPIAQDVLPSRVHIRIDVPHFAVCGVQAELGEGYGTPGDICVLTSH